MLYNVEVNDSSFYRNWHNYTIKKVTANDEIIIRIISQHGINIKS